MLVIVCCLMFHLKVLETISSSIIAGLLIHFKAQVLMNVLLYLITIITFAQENGYGPRLLELLNLKMYISILMLSLSSTIN